MIIRNAKVFCEDGTFRLADVYTEGDVFSSKEAEGDREIVDAQGLYLIPGLTDVHFHGCVGYDFCDGTEEAIEKMALYEADNGVTTICPATMTLDRAELAGIFKTAGSYKNKKGAALCGINMEGPFINPAKKGAQNEAYIHAPDVDFFREMQELCGGLIKLVAIAPEMEGSEAFISAVKEEVVPSIAHTAADFETAKKALDLGAKQVTHLYNAMPPFSHRAPGVIGAACESKTCYVEMICDGIHIHPAVVRTTFKMFGDDRIVLISDSMMATGLTDGKYALGGQDVDVKGNRATLADGTIAGSATNLMDCLRTAVKEMDIPLGCAVKCAAVNSAKSIGIYDQYGSITPGKKANFLLINEDLDLKTIVIDGSVYKQN